MPRVFLTGRSCCFVARDVGDCRKWVSRLFILPKYTDTAVTTQLPVAPWPAYYGANGPQMNIVIQSTDWVLNHRTVESPRGFIRTTTYVGVHPPSLTQYFGCSSFIYYFADSFLWYSFVLFDLCCFDLCFDYLHGLGLFDLIYFVLCSFWFGDLWYIYCWCNSLWVSLNIILRVGTTQPVEIWRWGFTVMDPFIIDWWSTICHILNKVFVRLYNHSFCLG